MARSVRTRSSAWRIGAASMIVLVGSAPAFAQKPSLGAAAREASESEGQRRVDAPPAQRDILPEREAKHEERSEHEGTYGKPRGLLGPFTIGPQVKVLGLPQLFGAGIEGKIYNWAGFTFDYGFMPDITISNTKVGLSAPSLTLRAFPFQGAFFVGLGIGYQKLTGSQSATISGVPVTANLSVQQHFITPQIGWRWVWESGLFFGLEAGVQIQRSYSTYLASNADGNATLVATSQYQSIVNDANKVANDIGKASLPHLTVVRIGWLF